jgi:hypothetical protein
MRVCLLGRLGKIDSNAGKWVHTLHMLLALLNIQITSAYGIIILNYIAKNKSFENCNLKIKK